MKVWFRAIGERRRLRNSNRREGKSNDSTSTELSLTYSDKKSIRFSSAIPTLQARPDDTNTAPATSKEFPTTESLKGDLSANSYSCNTSSVVSSTSTLLERSLRKHNSAPSSGTEDETDDPFILIPRQQHPYAHLDFYHDSYPQLTLPPASSPKQHQLLFIHGIPVHIIHAPTKIFVVDLVPDSVCESWRRLVQTHLSSLPTNGRRGWRTLYTYTKMDLPCADIPSFAPVVALLLERIRDVLAGITKSTCGSGASARCLRPRSWKEPHFLRYQAG